MIKYYTCTSYIKTTSLYQYICHVDLACKSFGINLFSDVYSSLEVYIIIENNQVATMYSLLSYVSVITFNSTEYILFDGLRLTHDLENKKGKNDITDPRQLQNICP